MSLAFLAKKSWHTSNLKNVEKVWKAEQKHAQEEQKLLELRKNIEEERQLKELRELQAKTTGDKVNQTQRVDWMYEGPMAASQAERTAEDYLLGKEYKPEAEKNELKQLSERPGSLYMGNATSKITDTFSRLNEDPMMMIKRQQKAAQLAVLKNPAKMKRLKDKVEKELEEKKAAKKAKKEAKKAKKEKKRAKERSKSPSQDRKSRERDQRSPDRQRRSQSPPRDCKPTSSRQRSPRHSRSRSRENKSRSSRHHSPDHRRHSPSKYRGNNRNSPRRHSPDQRRRSRSNPRENRRSSPRRHSPDYRRRSRSYSRRRSPKCSRTSPHRSPEPKRRRRSSSPRDSNHNRKSPSPAKEKEIKQPPPLKGYGVIGGENARKCKDVDTSSLGPNPKLLEMAREKKREAEAVLEARLKNARATTQSSTLNREERLREMVQDAQRREVILEERLRAKEEQKAEEEAAEAKSTGQNPAFLQELNHAAYIGSSETMSERLNRNKHYIQRNANSSNFMNQILPNISMELQGMARTLGCEGDIKGHTSCI
ncbi:pre-mRNA-splicing factor CWC25 [Thraustotheca clavata]|uniref:Pre-mRNA-splicing factor CWC25 n=1 Tax=Thraustotheca clavata TaxID=74557 RepID=A0A1V9Y7G5_9STRA|nr:pre-mRNA-splicing factor CWC25 [Thraustotheca clavata]